MINDSPLYTGVDEDGLEGIFGNEAPEETTKKVLQEQERKLKELTPQLQDIINMIDEERAIAIQFIADTVDNMKDSDDVLRGELIGAARYRRYLDTLKSKYTLALGEARGRDD